MTFMSELHAIRQLRYSCRLYKINLKYLGMHAQCMLLLYRLLETKQKLLRVFQGSLLLDDRYFGNLLSN